MPLIRTLREALGTMAEDRREALGIALSALTFLGDDAKRRYLEPAFWDAWWRSHGGDTRRQWAEEALRQRRSSSPGYCCGRTAAADAAEYLLTQQNVGTSLVQRLAQHRDWPVRLAVAHVVGRTDRACAVRLLVREFDSQYVAACSNAEERLRMLTGMSHRSDCRSIAERDSAAAYWTNVIDLTPILALSVEWRHGSRVDIELADTFEMIPRDPPPDFREVFGMERVR